MVCKGTTPIDILFSDLHFLPVCNRSMDSMMSAKGSMEMQMLGGIALTYLTISLSRQL